MKGLPFVLLFTAMTFVAWGTYGPVLHHGAEALEHDSMRAFVGVGIAYFLIAVLFPLLILQKFKESGSWTMSGAIYSLIAGAVGAVGALGIILALGYGGQTLYVMPLVFGFAPVVNTLVTALMSRTFNQLSPVFVLGIITAALGAGGVLFFKPPPGKPVAVDAMSNSVEDIQTQPDASADDVADPVTAPTPESPNSDVSEPSNELSQAPDPEDLIPAGVEEAPADQGPRTVLKPALADKDAAGNPVAADSPSKRPVDIPMVALSIVVAALCWGSYGPMLHIGQGKMKGSRLRPFMCVGLAYFFIAVAAPLVLIYSRADDAGAWTFGGMTWSILAGVAGAIGALGVILAFNAGGKPYYVMPLVFGFAPVINTFISLSQSGSWGSTSLPFWISLAVVIAGAVTVLVNAPRPKPKPQSA